MEFVLTRAEQSRQSVWLGNELMNFRIVNEICSSHSKHSRSKLNSLFWPHWFAAMDYLDIHWMLRCGFQIDTLVISKLLNSAQLTSRSCTQQSANQPCSCAAYMLQLNAPMWLITLIGLVTFPSVSFFRPRIDLTHSPRAPSTIVVLQIIWWISLNFALHIESFKLTLLPRLPRSPFSPGGPRSPGSPFWPGGPGGPKWLVIAI